MVILANFKMILSILLHQIVKFDNMRMFYAESQKVQQ